MQGAKTRDVVATGTVKTPPKGVRPALTDQAVAGKAGDPWLVHPTALVMDMGEDAPRQSEDDRQVLAKATEEIVRNRDDVARALGVEQE